MEKLSNLSKAEARSAEAIPIHGTEKGFVNCIGHVHHLKSTESTESEREKERPCGRKGEDGFSNRRTPCPCARQKEGDSLLLKKSTLNGLMVSLVLSSRLEISLRHIECMFDC